jgi:hypothetical protein
MLRDIDRGLMAHAIRARLVTELDLDAPEIKPIASKFFAAIDIPLRKGQSRSVELHLIYAKEMPKPDSSTKPKQ